MSNETPLDHLEILDLAARGCMSGRMSEWPQLQPAIQAGVAEIGRSRAIVDKLPKTADNVSVVPGVDYVYMAGWINSRGQHLSHPNAAVKEWLVWCDSLCGDHECDDGRLQAGSVHFSYSTREAAIAAKEAGQ